MKATIVRYTTHPEAADENQKLVEGVFAELNADDPGGLRYAVFRLADGVTFVHLAITEDDGPLSTSPAFARFQEGLPDRVAGPPAPSRGDLIGSYHAMDS